MTLTVEEVEKLIAAKNLSDITEAEINLWVEVLAENGLLARARQLKRSWLIARTTVEVVEDLLVAKQNWDDINEDEVYLWVDVLARARLLAGAPLLARAQQLKALWLTARRDKLAKPLLNVYLHIGFKSIDEDTKLLLALSEPGNPDYQSIKDALDEIPKLKKEIENVTKKGILGIGLTDKAKDLQTQLLMYAYYHSSNRKRLFQFKWDDKYIFRQAALRRRLQVNEEITMDEPPEEEKAGSPSFFANLAVGASTLMMTMAYFYGMNPGLVNAVVRNLTGVTESELGHGGHGDLTDDDEEEEEDDEDYYYEERKPQTSFVFAPKYYV